MFNRKRSFESIDDKNISNDINTLSKKINTINIGTSNESDIKLNKILFEFNKYKKDLAILLVNQEKILKNQNKILNHFNIDNSIDINMIKECSYIN
jgi:hypothetical protein